MPHDADPQRPTGPQRRPWDAAPDTRALPEPQKQPPSRLRTRLPWTTLAFVVLMTALAAGRATTELPWPQAIAYWKDLWVSPGLSAVRTQAMLDGKPRPALAVSGSIGAAAASWLRSELDAARLAPGDVVVLSSPGGDVDQAIIMGEIIRARQLVTAVGTVDATGRIQPAYCASACVLVFAGGSTRVLVAGARLGVHRFTSSGPADNAVANTQRTTGRILGYLARMGVDRSLVELMSASSDIHWLSAGEAAATKLVTDPG